MHQWCVTNLHSDRSNGQLADSQVLLLVPPHWYEYMDRQSVPQYKADPADSHTELQPLIWTYESAISPQYKADPTDSHTELLPLIWICNQSTGTRLTPRTVSWCSYIIKMKRFHWTRCKFHKNREQLHHLHGSYAELFPLCHKEKPSRDIIVAIPG